MYAMGMETIMNLAAALSVLCVATPLALAALIFGGNALFGVLEIIGILPAEKIEAGRSGRIAKPV